MTATDLLALAIFGGRKLWEIKWYWFGVANRAGDYDLGALGSSSATLASAQIAPPHWKVALQFFGGPALRLGKMAMIGHEPSCGTRTPRTY